LGNIYRTSKKYELALKFYKKSLECKKIDPLCFVNIALSYISLFDYENAYDYMMMAKNNLNEIDGLSKGNIEYVKEQVGKYLYD
jgi:tetratricopeptide (TPR) repeat protein